MKFRTFLLSVCILTGFSAFAQNASGDQDARAVEILKSMGSFLAAQQAFKIKGAASMDAQLDHGLMVSNTYEIKVTVQRPGSMHLQQFDGFDSREFYLHDGQVVVFNSDNGVYSKASVPGEIDPALEYALDELEIDLPLADLVGNDPYSHLVQEGDEVLYLTAKARVAGADCHHVAVRTDDLDVQLWIQEGNQPLPRRIVLTNKWAGGSPRFVANMMWNIEPEIDSNIFNFAPPEGASEIGFIGVSTD